MFALDKRYPWARFGRPAEYGSYGVAKRLEKIDQTLSLAGMRLLDLGCGNGSYTTELARRAAWTCGLDLQFGQLKSLPGSLPRVQGAGERLPFKDQSFDCITMIEVLEHTGQDTSVLDECRRVLKDGGKLVLFVPNKLYPFESHPSHLGALSLGTNVPFVSWLPGFLHRRISSARIYSRRKITRMARAAGFEVSKVGYIFPPLDYFPLFFKHTYRRWARRLEETPLRNFGVSIFLVLVKPKTNSCA
jgi:2-polyprenyl-3-methyl-5-hydroxy-6-metoxy-1,4-benzoquinol methylase